MNRKKALTNITVSIILKLIILLITLLLRRYLLKYLGNEAIGIFSLFTSIVGFLSIAELGIGSAIMFSMYKPLVEGNRDEVSGLYHLYNKIYRIIFMVILVVGLGITPLIPLFAKDNTGSFNIYISYIIYLMATIIPYMYAHKTSFINANLDNYLTVTIKSIGVIFETILQILLLVFITTSLKTSFNLFMIILVVSALLQMIFTEIIFKIKYKDKLTINKELDSELKKDVYDKTRAMFFHKVGGLIVNSTDNIIISGVLSVVLLGIFTNYITLVMGLTGLISLVFTSLTSVIGHSYAKSSTEEFQKQFNIIYTVNYLLGFIFFLGFYSVIDNAILIIFSNDQTLLLSKSIVIIITLNQFIQFMRNSVLVFKDASGLFYNDRYKPLVEGLTNLLLSLLFVRFWGIAGVLIATIITNLLITNIVEPFILFKYGFNSTPKEYYFKNYMGIIVFGLGLITYNIIPINFNNIYVDTIMKGLLSIGVSTLFILMLYLFHKETRRNINYLFKEAISIIRKK